MDTKTITLLWMDDREEIYPDVTTTVREGVLHIHQYTGQTHVLTAEWHWSMINIRGWWPASQARPGWLG
jgi:hypothetical protein